jgi:hypothetical protein
MNAGDDVLRAIQGLHEATEMGFKSVEMELAAQRTRTERLEREVREGFAGVYKRLDRLERPRARRRKSDDA